MQSKRGELDSITLFFAAIIVVVVLVIFFFSASLFKQVSGVKTGTESVKLIEIDGYMAKFHNLFEGRQLSLSDKTQKCVNTGEVWSKYLGKCVCDAYHGWTNEGYPELSYEPPCVNVNSLTKVSLMHDSLNLTKHDRSDEGYCVAFFSQKYFYYMLTSPDPSELVLEFLNYDSKGYYVRKVNDDFMKIFKVENQDASYNAVTREYCYKRNRDYRNYLVFYTESVDNLNEGNVDDVGYCLPFDDEGAISTFMRTTRENCKMIDKSDDSYDYSFFVSDLGKLPVNSSELFRDVVISERFFPNFNPMDDNDVVVEGELRTTEEIEEKCPNFWKYNLVFITGLYDSVEGVSADELDGIYSRRSSSACARVWQFLKKNEDNPLLKKAHRFEYEVLDKEKGEICCYGTRLS